MTWVARGICPYVISTEILCASSYIVYKRRFCSKNQTLVASYKVVGKSAGPDQTASEEEF